LTNSTLTEYLPTSRTWSAAARERHQGRGRESSRESLGQEKIIEHVVHTKR
jgi:hypothetical protein